MVSLTSLPSLLTSTAMQVSKGLDKGKLQEAKLQSARMFSLDELRIDATDGLPTTLTDIRFQHEGASWAELAELWAAMEPAPASAGGAAAAAAAGTQDALDALAVAETARSPGSAGSASSARSGTRSRVTVLSIGSWRDLLVSCAGAGARSREAVLSSPDGAGGAWEGSSCGDATAAAAAEAWEVSGGSATAGGAQEPSSATSGGTGAGGVQVVSHAAGGAGGTRPVLSAGDGAGGEQAAPAARDGAREGGDPRSEVEHETALPADDELSSGSSDRDGDGRPGAPRQRRRMRAGCLFRVKPQRMGSAAGGGGHADRGRQLAASSTRAWRLSLGWRK